jgi:ATP-dependent exoDNAse (exonuclease V) beta subunit
MIMAADPTDEVMANVNIQGVWDSREEAKYIVTRIRKRSKSRMKRVIEALKSAMGVCKAVESVIDPSEIAIITRSANHLAVIIEALESGGIPYVVYDSKSEGRKPRPVYPSGGIIQANLMHPVALMTMHRAKGEEFDEVYLPGWSEGEFPHPTAVSSNRVDEERRLAYVAISRARSNVMITHSFVRRDLNQGPNLGLKNITAQVKPSRFLYELVPDAQKYAREVVTNSNYFKKNERNQNIPSVVWNRGRGTKEMIAGGNLPAYFTNTFKTPKDFENPRQVDPIASCIESPTKVTLSAQISETKPNVADPDAKKKLSEVIFGLNQLAQRVRGSKTKYKQKFRANIKDWLGFTRGTVPTFTDEWMLEGSRITPDLLREITTKQASGKKAFSQCSATQLGLYLVSRLSEKAASYKL